MSFILTISHGNRGGHHYYSIVCSGINHLLATLLTFLFKLLKINPFTFIFASRMLHYWYRILALFLFRLICGWFYSELLGGCVSNCKFCLPHNDISSSASTFFFFENQDQLDLVSALL
jgi:hypothetical protein